MRVFIALSAFAAVDVTATLCTSTDDCRAGKDICDTGVCRRLNKCDGVTCSGANEQCQKKTGACECQDGFLKNSSNVCKPDACVENNCHQHAKCTPVENDQFGYFEATCACKEGKRGDGKEFCVKDYCGLGMDKCMENSTCKPLGKKYNYDYDCQCLPGFTGTGSRQLDYDGSGYRSDCEHFPCDEKLITPRDTKYEVVLPEADSGNSWGAAQQLCREKGAYWDLLIVDNQEEHNRIMELTNCATNGFWVGTSKEFPGADFQTVLKDEPDFLNKWKSGQPSALDKELCVRMRLGKYNDANCRMTYTDKKSSGVGMGYICEKHNRRVEEGVKCEQKDNDRVAPFKTAIGCSQPTCLGKGNFNVVDAWWRPAKGHGLAKLYGFTISITLNAKDINQGGSVLLRFADGNKMGNVQTYNLKFFGFYNNNNDILFHTKWFNTDRDDKMTVIITVDNITSPDYPEAFYWPGRVSKHFCFQNGISRSNTVQAPVIMDNLVKVMKGEDVDAESVTSVAFKDGQVKRIKAN